MQASRNPCHFQLLTAESLRLDPEKERAIMEMPCPQKQDDILSLNEIVNYLSRLLPQYPDVMKPLADLKKCRVVCWCLAGKNME